MTQHTWRFSRGIPKATRQGPQNTVDSFHCFSLWFGLIAVCCISDLTQFKLARYTWQPLLDARAQAPGLIVSSRQYAGTTQGCRHLVESGSRSLSQVVHRKEGIYWNTSQHTMINMRQILWCWKLLTLFAVSDVVCSAEFHHLLWLFGRSNTTKWVRNVQVCRPLWSRLGVWGASKTFKNRTVKVIGTGYLAKQTFPTISHEKCVRTQTQVHAWDLDMGNPWDGWSFFGGSSLDFRCGMFWLCSCLGPVSVERSRPKNKGRPVFVCVLNF